MRSMLQHHFCPIVRAWLLVALALAPLSARADTVASLLGNFTVNQYCGLKLTADAVDLHYAVVFGQLPALRELHLADADGDGVTTQAERDAYVARLAPSFAKDLKLALDGSPVPLQALHWTSSLPTEQGGFSLRLDVDFSGALPPGAADARHTLTFTNQNYPGQIGWNEITVQAPQSIAVFDTDAFSTSLTAGLTAAVRTLPPAGPLAERSVHLSFVQGAAPPGAQILQARAGAPPSNARTSAQDSSSYGESLWLQRQTKSLVDSISAPHVSPEVAVLALLIAFVLGAMHALSPGHGKTIVGAYLIGSRGTPRHALFLGVTVTVTHTLGVFVLGFATLVASRYIVPERLFPILSLISGLLVLGMGVFLLAQRWRTAQGHHHDHLSGDPANHSHDPQTHDHHGHAHHSEAHRAHSHHSHAHEHHEHEHEHEHEHHDHEHDGHSPHEHVHHDHAEHAHLHHEHAHGVARRHGASAPTGVAALTHSHGGKEHSHLPPDALGDEISWRSLLALGISGGLVPCPSAMVLLLAAVALNKTAYGLLLVVAFSVGLAATLTLVGLTFLYARNRFRRPAAASRWPQLLPVASAAAITLIGAVLSVGAVRSIFTLH
jgi:ABC-type nickel/cobalt efflux system permease component RcnA